MLVKGKWRGGKRVVTLPLLKNQLQSRERVVKVSDDGKQATTVFRPLEIGNEASLLEAELKTGRTHQIRVHASYIGYPIAGDKKYGDTEFNLAMKKLGLKRIFLHSKEISFCWQTREQVHLVTDLCDELRKVLNKGSGLLQ